MWRFARTCSHRAPRNIAFITNSFGTSPILAEAGGVLGKVVREHIDEVKLSGLFKEELSFTGDQSAVIRFQEDERDVLNFCAPRIAADCYFVTVCNWARPVTSYEILIITYLGSSNYLGLANHPDLVKAAKEALDSHGLGLSSMRYICGTTDLHQKLERTIAEYYGTEDAMIYPSCYDANMGLFQAILTEEDAVISDTLNHGSSIDGMRLSKAKRHRYVHEDMQDLEETLKEAEEARMRLIVTDGVFSMTGHMAKLDRICDLAERYNANVMVDDCQATGVAGPTGRGSVEACGVAGRVDIINSTLGKAVSGVNGGFTTGSTDIIQCLRQRSRPYIFSNSLAPPLVGASIAAFEMLTSSNELLHRLHSNANHFREQMIKAGFDLKEGVSYIVPIMLGDSTLANEMAQLMLKKGVYVVSHAYPVVPKGQAGVRVQISAAHTREHLDQAIQAFTEVGRKLGVVE